MKHRHIHCLFTRLKIDNLRKQYTKKQRASRFKPCCFLHPFSRLLVPMWSRMESESQYLMVSSPSLSARLMRVPVRDRERNSRVPLVKVDLHGRQ